MSSIYDLDPRIRELLNLDKFLDNLTVYEFIEELSKEHVLKNKDVNSLKHLDPKPFIRTFESTLRELKQLSTEASSRQTALEKEVNKYELDHSRNIISLGSRTESVDSQFKQLDDHILKVNSAIAPLTENLTKTINAKQRSLATIFLIEIYTEFYNYGESQELEHLINGNINSKKKCASTVAQLLSLSQKLISDDLENSQQCHDLIQKYSETMENSLLEDFDHGYRNRNLERMKEIADILYDFNGGTAVIKNFINQHELFLNGATNDNLDFVQNEQTWNELSDPNNYRGSPESFIDRFFEEIIEALKDETVVVVEVFREPVTVLQLFIQRVYAQLVQTRIETLLKNSYSSSTLAYLRTLYSLYNSTGNFTKDLKTFFNSSLGKDNPKLDELISVLDQSYSDLFTQHLSDNKYFDLEKKTLENIFFNVTSHYELLNEAKITNKLSVKVTNSKTVIPETNEYEILKRRSKVGQFRTFMKNQLERNSTFRRSSSNNSLNEAVEKQQKLDEKLNMENTEMLIKSTVESISRLVELSPYRAADFGLEVLEILLIGIGKAYVDLGLEVAYTELGHQDNKSDSINLEYLYNVKAASEILYLVSTCIRTIILPLANNNPNIRQRITNLTNSYVSRVELTIDTLIKETLSLGHDKVISALSKQKKKDYMTTDLFETDTPACVSLCTFLSEFNAQIKEYLNGENLDSTMNELGQFTFTQLFEHYKNFQINSTGGIVVTKDIISYQSVIDQWKMPELSEKFQLLREIANLFTVQPELINSLTKEGQLANVKPYILRQFISKRTDYNTNTNYLEKLRGII